MMSAKIIKRIVLQEEGVAMNHLGFYHTAMVLSPWAWWPRPSGTQVRTTAAFIFS